MTGIVNKTHQFAKSIILVSKQQYVREYTFILPDTVLNDY